MQAKKLEIENALGIDDGSYFVHQSVIRVTPYDKKFSPIKVFGKDKSLTEISESPLQILSHHLLTPIEKYHVCYLDVKKNMNLHP